MPNHHTRPMIERENRLAGLCLMHLGASSDSHLTRLALEELDR
jgi:hypothetical protein